MAWKTYEEIEIYQLARGIAADIWELTLRQPVWNDRGIAHQMRNSSGSMMDNIAEGFERGSNNEFKTFLAYSKGSAGELRSQLTRLNDRAVLSNEEYEALDERIKTFSRRTYALIKSLKASDKRGARFD